jgi:thiamine pyrophosphate-dependent acetolactate synthase large subunit-like protein
MSSSRKKETWYEIVVRVLKANEVRLVAYVPASSMGLATPLALGVATAQPQRKVFALDGDGSILMQLGALGTVAAEASKNLAIIIWDNGIHQITGSQKTLTSSGTDLVAMAKGAGIAQSYRASDEAHFESLIARTLVKDGPWVHRRANRRREARRRHRARPGQDQAELHAGHRRQAVTARLPSCKGAAPGDRLTEYHPI